MKRTIACVGGGPSLTKSDVELLRDVCSVIAVNDAYRLAPWADALYASDLQWWKWHDDALMKFAGRKYAITSSVARAEDFPPDVQVLRNTGPFGLELDRRCLRDGRNSGYAAINLAVHFGATRILLLGYDMMRGDDDRGHWFGEHPVVDRSPYEQFRESFDTMTVSLAALGIEVLNCSRRTALTTFPVVALEDALALEPI